MSDDQGSMKNGLSGSREPTRAALSRRRILKAIAGAGVGSAVFQRALAAQAQQEAGVTAEMINQAAWVAGLEFTDDEVELMRRDVDRTLAGFD